MTLPGLAPGAEVKLRGLRWEIVRTQPLGAQTALTLRGLEGALQGEEFEILTPFETVEPLARPLDPTRAGPLVRWLIYHQAYLLEQALGPDALVAVDPGRVILEPYQLVPVMRALRMSRVRMLLADGVGLGKTVEAALLLVELIARRVAHRVLVVSPAGPLLEQWRDELRDKFGLRFEVADDTKLKDIRREHELGANPFDHLPLALASIDFLKQDKIVELLDRAVYDVVVIDEAHHCFDYGKVGERDDTLRRRLAEVLAARSDALLLLTATPHNGDDRSFASLCELLDPSLVDGRGTLRADRYKHHVVRRLRDHIRDPKTGEPRFPQRQVDPVQVRFETGRTKFAELQRRLLAFALDRIRWALKTSRYDEALSFFALLKRSVSTAAACASTLSVVSERVGRFLEEVEEDQKTRSERLKTQRELRKKLARLGTLTIEEETASASLDVEDVARQIAADVLAARRTQAAAKRAAAALAEIEDLRRLAEEARAEDPKLAEITAQIRAIRRQEPTANVLIFTEYVDSQSAVAAALADGGFSGVLTLRGDDDGKSRKATLGRFTSEDGLILVSTDTAAEGLNLQARCHHLIHVELPFNPNRLEQRNGRIDRYGQTHAPIVRYLYLAGTFEARLLIKLVAKWERQRAQLKYVPNTLGLSLAAERTEERLLSGLVESEGALFKFEEPLRNLTEQEIDAASEAGYRDLMSEMESVLGRFETAAKLHNWLGAEGLNAEVDRVTEAGAAVDRGRRSSEVDLLRFTADAVRLDGGRAEGPRDGAAPIVELKPPDSWGTFDGVDPETKTILVTNDGAIGKDPASGRAVRFLGRADPLVQRALERVRNVSFGGGAHEVEDGRVSAVDADVAEPSLLFTFAGRVSSAKGREWERLLAVRTGCDGHVIERLLEPATWLRYADRRRARSTEGVWTKLFAGVDLTLAESAANTAATEAFRPTAEQFLNDHRRRLDAERHALEAWLRERATTLATNENARAIETTADLFGGQRAAAAAAPSWITEPDPLKRLSAFASDGAVRSALRREAELACNVFQRRTADLAARAALRAPEVQLVGLLLLVPGGRHGD